MRSAMPGIGILEVEVTSISRHGFWLRLDEREIFLGFEHFPWFHDASVRQIQRVERPSPDRLRWPALDIDLAVASLQHPERFPLVSHAGPTPPDLPQTEKRSRRSRR